MFERGMKWWWVPGFGVILVGCFFLIAGLASWVRAPVGVVDLVDGVVIAFLCLIVGAVILRRHADEAEDVRIAARLSDRRRD